MGTEIHGDEYAGASVEDWLVGGQPDWDAIDFEVPCSRCGYELRMLTLPRCPECGLQFQWREILEARLQQSKFLFEYRWRERPVRSYIQTVWRALRPWRFWDEVSIHEQIHLGPLVFMFLSAPVVFVLTFHGLPALIGSVAWAIRAVPIYLPGWGVVDDVADTFLGIGLAPFEIGPMYAVVLVPILLVLIAAATLLCSLRQTLGRCRVRSAQVFRVAAYTGVPVCFVMGLVSLGVALMPTFSRSPGSAMVMFAATAYLMPILLLWGYLAIGLRRYLHLPRAWLLGFTAALVAILFSAAMMTLVIGFIEGY